MVFFFAKNLHLRGYIKRLKNNLCQLVVSFGGSYPYFMVEKKLNIGDKTKDVVNHTSGIAMTIRQRMTMGINLYIKV